MKRGDIYATFHSVTAGDANVYVSRSSDDGSTWSTPAVINDDGVAGALQFWPAVIVAPGGNVDFLFYDRRENPGTPITNVYWAQSIDGGTTFRPNVRLTDVATNRRDGSRPGGTAEAGPGSGQRREATAGLPLCPAAR